MKDRREGEGKSWDCQRSGVGHGLDRADSCFEVVGSSSVI